MRTLLAIHKKSREPSFWEVMDSFVLLAHVSLASSKILLQWLLACLITLDSEDLFFWYKWKKWFLWTITAAQAAENHGDDWGLNPLNANLNPPTKFTSSSRRTEFKDILQWNIPQMITKTIPISTRIVISNAMKRGFPFWIWWKVTGNWDNKMIRVFQWRGSHGRKILHFSYYTFMIFLMLSVILLSMLMIILSTLSVTRTRIWFKI